eukprot:scaffold173889_cov26-Tisochrysis_lutea.AAC.3
MLRRRDCVGGVAAADKKLPRTKSHFPARDLLTSDPSLFSASCFWSAPSRPSVGSRSTTCRCRAPTARPATL